MSEIDYHKNMIIALEDEVNRLRKQIVDTSLTEHSDASILLPIVMTCMARCAEQYDMSVFVDGVINSVDDTGIDLNTTIEALIRMGVDVDLDWFRNEYEVTVSVPVSVTLTVKADDADSAESEAIGMIECDGLDHFQPDYDLSWGIEVDVETV